MNRASRVRGLVEHRAWLTAVRLPAYAPGLNPVEGLLAHLKRSVANLTKKTLNEIARLIKTRLNKMQYRPQLISGFIARTGQGDKPP